MTAADTITAGFDQAIDELDSLVDRVVNPAPKMWLDYDPWSYGISPWAVKNGAAKDVCMARFSYRVNACDFMEAICRRTPGATIDYDARQVHP